MDVQLTVRNAASQAQVDLLVTADDRRPVASLLAALRSAVGAADDAAVSSAGRVLPSDGEVADCGLATGDIVVVGEAAERRLEPVVDVVVSTGPDAGRRCALPAGRYVAGRDPACEIRISDSAISRQHLALDVTPADVGITDLGTTNGSALNGVAVQLDRIAIEALPVTLQVGDSELRIAKHRPSDASTVGRVALGPTPRLDPAAEHLVITMPSPPTATAPPHISVLPAVVPLVAGGVLTLVLHQWEFIAFTAMSPLMIIGQAVTDRRAARRRNETARREHTNAVDCVRRELLAGLVDECVRRHAAAPDLGGLCSPMAAADGVLWGRAAGAPDALHLRLGQADQPSDIEVRGGPAAIASAVPLIAALPAVSVLGVIGTPVHRRALARSLILQAATLHDPAALRILVIAPGNAATWGWVRWLPHVASEDSSCVAAVGFDVDQVAERLAGLSAPTATRHETLVVVDGAAPTAIDAVPEGSTVIWCAPDRRSLPPTCGAVAAITSADRPRLDYVSPTTRISDAIPDLVALDVATTVARHLAPLSTRRPGAGRVPRAVRWGELGDVRLASRWEAGPTTELTLGVGAAGSVGLDLVRDGPHALIAGTTGAGKSELLLTIIAELASRNRPDQLSFLLVDHKGGAALGPCARLPHTVGVVTDLDRIGTRRALQSIGAELRRRERQLAAAGVPDFEAYQRLDSPAAMTRLVVVVDEFAALVGEEPAGIAELVAIAQRGRSLGLHLILATQRPEGLVASDIRANTRIRICLGVTREQDSRDVIDSPAAVNLSRSTPGRAYLRIGPGDLRLFQAARVTGQQQPAAVIVRVVPDVALGDPPRAVPAQDGDPGTELEALIDATIEASDRWSCDPPPRPWLPSLPRQLPLSALPRDDGRVAWGLVDVPQEGRQPPLILTPERGTTTIIGTTRSGRTTAAVSIAVAMAAAQCPDELHIWGIDAADGLSPLAGLGHCGSVIRATDHERVRSLLDHLTVTVRDRRTRGDHDRLTLVLIVDGWEAVLESASEHGRTDIAADVLRLATDGASVDVHLVITGGRGLLSGRLASVAGERVVLRLADPTDYLMLGIPRCDLPGDLPAGRGIRASDHAMVQVARASSTDFEAAARWPRPRRPPSTFPPLPDRITLGEVHRSGPPVPASVTLGLRAIDNAPVWLSRANLGDAFLVVGSRRSGRSSALRLIGEQLGDRTVVTVADRRSPLADCPAAIPLATDDPQHAVAVLDRLIATGQRPHLLVDDLDQLEPGVLLDRIDHLIRHHDPADGVVAVSATIDSATTAFRGPLSTARRSRHGLLLRPTSRRDGDVLGIDLRHSVLGTDPPGRGWLVVGGEVSRVQVAEPNSLAQPSTEFELSALGARRRE